MKVPQTIQGIYKYSHEGLYQETYFKRAIKKLPRLY